MPTPLGNLADLSPRAARVLAAADCIACEDTRRTGLLLHLTGLPKRPLVVVEAHREAGAIDGLIERLRAGGRIALVSDGGTPCLSDPGRKLVAAAAAAGVGVISLPGPSAVTAAFAASGFAAPFTFHGFLARKGRDRACVLETIAARAEETAILFESPFRLAALLKELAEDVRWTERPLVLAQEISKIHETWHRGSAAQLLARLQARAAIKGEWTVLIGPAPRAGGASAAEDADEAGEPGTADPAAPEATAG
ncbi:MAG: 16S rRNA (cytidine(1402)-2'-O)-methyltransferase [Planctomycetota bacterium]